MSILPKHMIHLLCMDQLCLQCTKGKSCSQSHQPLRQSDCHIRAVNSSHAAILKQSTRHGDELTV